MDGEPRSYTYFKNGANPQNGQRLASDGEHAYAYDANGNTATRTGVTFGWDADDRMTSISGTVTASYAYDYQGRRTGKTVNGATASVLYDGLNLVRTNGASAADYLFGPGIDEPLAMLREGSVYYVSVDGLGSVTLLSNAFGTVETTYLYDAWGVLREQTGSLANDFGYTAREFAEAGLWFYRARYYQPGIGRFVSEDPSRFNAGVNQFAYVLANPILMTDPGGLEACCPEPNPIKPKRRGELEHPLYDLCQGTNMFMHFYAATEFNTALDTERYEDWKRHFRKLCSGPGQVPICTAPAMPFPTQSARGSVGVCSCCQLPRCLMREATGR